MCTQTDTQAGRCARGTMSARNPAAKERSPVHTAPRTLQFTKCRAPLLSQRPPCGYHGGCSRPRAGRGRAGLAWRLPPGARSPSAGPGR